MLALYVLSVVAPFCAFAWPSGAPEEACSTLMPKHKNNRPQPNSQSPYAFTQSTDIYRPGDQVIVYVRAPPEHPFKGMLVQAYDPRTNETIGEFLEGEGLKKLSCGGMTHSNPKQKKSATLVWVAPQTSGNVKFRATILRQFNTFYHGLNAKVQSSR